MCLCFCCSHATKSGFLIESIYKLGFANVCILNQDLSEAELAQISRKIDIKFSYMLPYLVVVT